MASAVSSTVAHGVSSTYTALATSGGSGGIQWVSVQQDIITDVSGEGAKAILDEISSRHGRDFDKLTPDAYNYESENLIIGSQGNDWLSASTGNSTIFGRNGNDTIFGGAGDDLLFGGAGNDAISSGGYRQETGKGSDTINGGKGDDWIDGGGRSGRDGWVDFADAPDLFLFERAGDGFGRDVLEGFNDENDRIVFDGYSRDDLIAPVVIDTRPYDHPKYPDAIAWSSNFAFSDGSTLFVTGISQGTPSFTEGSDYFFV